MAALGGLMAASLRAGARGPETLTPDHERVAMTQLGREGRVAFRVSPGRSYQVLEHSRRDDHVRVRAPDGGATGWVRYAPAEMLPPEPAAAEAGPPGGWGRMYRHLEGRHGPELKEGLRKLNRNLFTLGYDAARDVMFSQLDNQGGRVRCVYTGIRFPAGKRPGKGPDGQSMNTEHTWPQGSFQKKEPMRSDLHHLFPSEYEANHERGSKPFAELEDDEGIPIGARGARSTEEAFEPPREHKGNVARAMFYFSVQYSLPIPRETEAALLRWHQEDPVDDAERARNEGIYGYQNSRNFFVDRPELVQQVGDF